MAEFAENSELGSDFFADENALTRFAAETRAKSRLRAKLSQRTEQRSFSSSERMFLSSERILRRTSDNSITRGSRASDRQTPRRQTALPQVNPAESFGMRTSSAFAAA
jgi:hypothetical protein